MNNTKKEEEEVEVNKHTFYYLQMNRLLNLNYKFVHTQIEWEILFYA